MLGKIYFEIHLVPMHYLIYMENGAHKHTLIHILFSARLYNVCWSLKFNT